MTQGKGRDAQDAGLVFYTQPRRMVFHRLTIEEIEQLYEAGNYKTLDLSMFSLCVGVFSSLLVTMLTVKLDSAIEVAGFIAGTCVFALGSVVFAIRARMQWNSAKRVFRRIKESAATDEARAA